MILDKIKALIVDQLDVDANDITENTNIRKDLGADSLDLVEMFMNFESEFDIIVDDDEAANLITIKDVIALIEKKK